MQIYILCGRIFNLFAYVLICIAILEILPFKKNVFFTIYLTPMLLLLAGSYSVDGMCVGIVGLFIAYCLRLYESKEDIKTKQIVILAILFSLSLIAKFMSYFPICLLLLLLPVAKIFKQNKKTMIITMIIIAIISLVILSTASVENGRISDPRMVGTNAEEQVRFLINNPTSIIVIVINHVRSSLLNFNWLSYFCQYEFFGKAASIFVLQFIFVIYVAIFDTSKKFNTKERTIVLIAFFMSYLIGSFMLYISFTIVGKLSIDGYQARYLFPVLPLLLMIANKNDNQEKDENGKEKISTVLGMFIVICLMGAIS